jgi:molybdopterin/thiamine biosynthesis adenylyltransferase/rhodanese-related sulfurtransferase
MMETVREISPQAAHAHVAAGAVLVDVREPGEWAQGSPTGALRVPLGRLTEGLAELGVGPDVAVVCLCGSGKRSLAAAQTLSAQGFRASSVAGGFARWQADGLPYEIVSALDADARERYSRHLLLPEIGEAGQLRLGAARVVVVGAGGLGSPAACYLAAAGVGYLRLVDDDRVDRSNLQRQILHADTRVGALKVESAAATLGALNPRVAIDARAERLRAANVENLIRDVDVVLDGSDNLVTRYLLNDACVRLRKPLVYGAVHRFDGQVSVFWPGRGPCYRCLFPEPPPPDAAPNCAEAGVLGVVPGIVGLLQASEVIKLVLGLGEPLVGRLVTIDARTTRFREVRLPRDPQCPACGADAKLGPYVDAAPPCASDR